MKKNLNELLKREENLESLMSKSKDLSSVSVQFYKKAKSANNKCCSLY
jgi:synaptobrevin family protein YKT6